MTVSTRTPANIGAVDPFPGNTPGTIVGDDTALDTSDGDTSYVEVTDSGFGGFGTGDGMTFTWEPPGPISPEAVVTIEADWWTDNNGAFTLYFVHPTLGSRSLGSFITGPDTDAHAYGDPQTLTVSSTWVEDGAAFLSGVEWGVLALRTDLFVPTLVRITRLSMLIDAPGELEPHLLFWRTDNLGAGASLIFEKDTRQSSGLVFGNH